MASTPAKYLNDFQFVDMKQQNRFIFEVDDITPYYVRASSLPNVDNNPVAVDTINSEYFLKGKSRWQTISLTIYDPVYAMPGGTPNGAAQLHTWLNEFHHNSSTDVDQLMQTYKRDARLTYVYPMGTPGDNWILHGCFCSSINWGDMDVTSDDLVLLEVEIRYDWAEYFG